MCCDDLQEAAVSKTQACSFIQGCHVALFFLGQAKFIPGGQEVLRQHGLTKYVSKRRKSKMIEVNLY